LISAPPVGTRRSDAAWVFFLGALFTLPWIGVGVMRLITGRDLGAGLQPSWLLLGVATVLLLPELWCFAVATRPVWRRTLVPAAAGIALSLVGLWWAPSGVGFDETGLRFGKQIIQLAVMLVFAVLPVFWLHKGRSLRAMAAAIVLGGVFQVFYGVWQGLGFYLPMPLLSALEKIFTSNPSILAGSGQLYLANALRDLPRLRGTACEPLYLGNFLLLAIPLVWLTGWSMVRRRLALVFLIGLLLATWSRGAWLAGGVAGAVFLGSAWSLRLPLPWGRIGRIVVIGTVGIGGLSALAVLAGYDELLFPWRRLTQSFSLLDWSNLTRFYSMQAAWRAFVLSPLVGIGWGQFAYHFAALVDPMGLQSMFTWPVVNNFPLAILCETGLLGFGGFLWLVAAIVVATGRHLRHSDGRGRLEVLLLLAAVVGVWTQLLTFSQYNLPHIWAGVGLLVGHLRREGE